MPKYEERLTMPKNKTDLGTLVGTIDGVNAAGHLDVFVNEGRTRNDRN